MQFGDLQRCCIGLAIGILLAVTGHEIFGFEQSQKSEPAKVYSVCQVLQQLKVLKDTAALVRGVLNAGPHGTFLSGNCPSHLTTKGFMWPDIIWLASPRDALGPFEADPNAHKRVRREIKRLRPREGDQVILTYVGVLEAKDVADGPVVGFGPDADAPARLVVKTVMDPRVLRSGVPEGPDPPP